MSKQQDSKSGVAFLSLLGLLFIGLKLTGYINWSWWWVLAPFWGGIALVVVLLICYGLGLMLIKIYHSKFGK